MNGLLGMTVAYNAPTFVLHGFLVGILVGLTVYVILSVAASFSHPLLIVDSEI